MLKISLIQQAAWDVPVDTMPLAAGYLKAVIQADAEIGAGVDVRICNFRGGATLYDMVRRLLDGPVPDILAFSVLGWNYRSFGCLAETYKHLNPAGVVVFGGVHVAYQAERVFREFPAVDVVVNGEGEPTFRDLVAHVLAGHGALDPADLPGLSYRRQDGSSHTTPDRERMANLDVIPSPFLTGAIPMTDAAGAFRYDVALMETNRGCPYKCSFCYWGGAIGQRVRSFSGPSRGNGWRQSWTTSATCRFRWSACATRTSGCWNPTRSSSRTSSRRGSATDFHVAWSPAGPRTSPTGSGGSSLK